MQLGAGGDRQGRRRCRHVLRLRPPAGPALRALRASAAHRPAGHPGRSRHLRELLSPAGGHLRELRAAPAVHLRGRRDADVCVVFLESGGRLRPLRRAATACARWPEGPVCESCYRAALSRRGTCEGCDVERRLVSPPGAGARWCCDCAGVPALARCADCGIEDRPYADGRCVRCALAERSARLLGGPRPELAGLHHAISSARQPYSAHNWLARSGGAAIMAEIASGALALTHEALDAHPRPGAARYVRRMLVAGDVLPARDEALIALEAWVTERVESVGDPEHQRLLRAYATWGVLRRARQRAERAKAVRTPTRHAKSRLLAAIAFLAWLAGRNRTLADAGQGDIEAWLAEGPASAREVKDFLAWAAQRKATSRFEIPSPPLREGTALDDDQRWAILARLLHDDGLCLTDRVAGCLVLLYAQQLSRIVAMTLDQVISDDDVYLRLGPGRVLVPEPMGALVVELAATGRPHVGLGSPAPQTWLFPGLHPGRPLHPGHLGQRLAKLGIDARAGRRSALMHLAGQLPAAVLAEMLHLHATTAVHWVAAAGGDWSTYAAQVARDR